MSIKDLSSDELMLFHEDMHEALSEIEEILEAGPFPLKSDNGVLEKILNVIENMQNEIWVFRDNFVETEQEGFDSVTHYEGPLVAYYNDSPYYRRVE